MDDKVEEYLKILYPQSDTFDKKENSNYERKKIFITENIDEIEKRYQTSKKVEEDKEEQKVGNEDTEECESNKNLEDKEILNNIIKELKIEKYFDLLHPEYETLSEEEKYYVLDDKMLIRECIDAIDVYYQDCKAPGSGVESFDWTDKMIIETALKLFNKQEKIFTPDDIEQFSSNVKYAEFKRAITNIKEIANEDKDEETGE